MKVQATSSGGCSADGHHGALSPAVPADHHHLMAVPADHHHLMAVGSDDLVHETTCISQTPEPRQLSAGGGAAAAGRQLDQPSPVVVASASSSSEGARVSPAASASTSLPTFKLLKVDSSGESLEETIQKYMTSQSGINQPSGQQQIIILKFSDAKEMAGVAKTIVKQSIVPTEVRQQGDDGDMWMEMNLPDAIDANATCPQTVVVQDASLFVSDGGSPLIEYCVADSKASVDCMSSNSSCSFESQPVPLPSSSSTPLKRVSAADTTPAAGGGKRRRSCPTSSSAGGSSSSSSTAGGSPVHKCPDCGEEFSAKYRLLAHMKLHDGKSPHLCVQCGELFPVKNMLSNHLLQHAGQLTCQVCARVLSTKRSLQRHMAQHTGEKDYKCSHCRKEFFDRIQLVEHLRTHTGEKPFACQVCSTAFARNSNLLAHMRIHRDEKPYRCQICSREFRWRNNMVLHQRKHDDAGGVVGNGAGSRLRYNDSAEALAKLSPSPSPSSSLESSLMLQSMEDAQVVFSGVDLKPEPDVGDGGENSCDAIVGLTGLTAAEVDSSAAMVVHYGTTDVDGCHETTQLLQLAAVDMESVTLTQDELVCLTGGSGSPLEELSNGYSSTGDV